MEESIIKLKDGWIEIAQYEGQKEIRKRKISRVSEVSGRLSETTHRCWKSQEWGKQTERIYEEIKAEGSSIWLLTASN